MGYDESGVYLVRDTLILAMTVVAPILLAGIVIGLVISIVQTITSIQDQSLSMVPKIVVMIAVAVALLPWMTLKLVEYAREVFLLF